MGPCAAGGGHACGASGRVTVYRLRVERLEESVAHARALADRLDPGERVELVVTAGGGRCKRFVIDADGACVAGGSAGKGRDP